MVGFVTAPSAASIWYLVFFLKEQKMDGKTLLLLATHGSTQQYSSCGIPAVGDQLRLRALVCKSKAEEDGEKMVTLKTTDKPRKCDIEKLSKLNQRIYKSK